MVRLHFLGPFLEGIAGLAVLVVALFAFAAGAQASEAEAAQRFPVTIQMFLSSRTDVCYDPGDVDAITKLARAEQDRINAEGGISGRKLYLEFLDDKRDAKLSIANMKQALAQRDTLALVGLSNSDRAKAVFEAEGRAIRESQIPFISGISVNSIFAEYPNVFTMRPSQDEERLPVMVQFMKQAKISRPAFVGIKNNAFSDSLADGLKSASAAATLIADQRMTLVGEALDPAEVVSVLADLKQTQPDMVFLNVGGGDRIAGFLKEMIAAGVTPPLFISGRIEDLPGDVLAAYPAALTQAVWDRLPEVYNDRLRRRISQEDPTAWIFEGRKISGAPGWSDGKCKPRSGGDDDRPDPFFDANLRAIGVGAQAADMVRLIAVAARSAGPSADMARVRAAVIDQLNTTYATGRGTFEGSFENWSFRPKTRAVARTPFLVTRPPNIGRTQLLQTQFVRVKGDGLRSISTLYLDIDMIRAFRVDDNEKSFFAEFYLALHDDGNGAAIEQVEFSNAFLDPQSNDRQITVRKLNGGGKSDAYPDDMNIYQVSGRFMFEPRLADYPFDTQRFSIDVRPKAGNTPFIVQPPPASLRDGTVATDGWTTRNQYVGYEEDFVRTTDAMSHEQTIVPFYKASFVWTMSRETTDYYLRVVVPLMFILMVAYLSIFIPQAHFEAIVTIQVTALLSAVALYLSLPKISADTTTLSDRIFIFNYMAISLMIGLSIARITPFFNSKLWLNRMLSLVHMAAIPGLVLLMAIYIYRATVNPV